MSNVNNSIEVYADLKLRHDDLVVGINADGNVVNIMFTSFTSAKRIFKYIRKYSYAYSIIDRYIVKLKSCGLRVVIHIRKLRLTILGPGSSLFARLIIRYILRLGI